MSFKLEKYFKNILLIGGEGYIGKVVAKYLFSCGYQVTSYDCLLYQDRGTLNCSNDSYKFVCGDMLDSKKLKKEIEKNFVVVLLAGLVGDPVTKKYPEESILINDKAIKNVIDLCAEYNSKKLIFISTCSNYGFIKTNNLASEDHELKPLSLYAKSKVSAEKYILSLKYKTGMNPTILRFATAFGVAKRMRFDLTVNEFTRELEIGNDLLVYDENTWRPYCHVLDFARLIQMIIEAPKGKVAWEVFNAGGDMNNATKKMIVDMILEKIPNGNVQYQEHGNDPRNYRVDFTKVNSILGFVPNYSIQNGIEELIAAIRDNKFTNIEKNPNYYGNYNIEYSPVK